MNAIEPSGHVPILLQPKTISYSELPNFAPIRTGWQQVAMASCFWNPNWQGEKYDKAPFFKNWQNIITEVGERYGENLGTGRRQKIRAGGRPHVGNENRSSV